MSMLNNVVGYWAYYIQGTYIWGAYIRVGLYLGGGAYIWNEVSVSICGGLIFGGGGLYSGGAYSRRFTVWLKHKMYK
jgi:hypothetical protein